MFTLKITDAHGTEHGCEHLGQFNLSQVKKYIAHYGIDGLNRGKRGYMFDRPDGSRVTRDEAKSGNIVESI